MKSTKVRNVCSWGVEATMCFALFALLVSSVQVRSEETNRVNITWGDVDGSLLTRDARMLLLVVSKWPRAPLYQRLSVLDVLVEKLTQRDGCPISESVEGAERYDMTVVAGRAAWLMERLMQVELPAIVPNATAEDLAKVQAVGKQMVAEYRNKSIESQRKLIQEPSVEQLKATYAGQITRGISTNAMKSCRLLTTLLREWFPLEKDMKEFEYIVGTNAASDEGGMVFSIDTGFVGTEFFFKVEGGKIKGVFVGVPK